MLWKDVGWCVCDLVLRSAVVCFVVFWIGDLIVRRRAGDDFESERVRWVI